VRKPGDVLRAGLVLALCALAVPCAGTAVEPEAHEAHHAEAAPGSEIVPALSWADRRAVLLSEGKSEAEADAWIAEQLASLAAMDRSAGDDRVGVAAPPFRFDAWLNSEPLSLEDLEGQVVLVRWWTDTCPVCASSAPAL